MPYTSIDIINHRLRNQKVTGTRCRKPEEVVKWLGAVQAQNYAGAKWALGLRVRSATDADVEHAFNEGRILRTHILRPTWHFVAPDDIRWMLALTAPRIKQRIARWFRQHGVDARLVIRSQAAIERALRDSGCLTRQDLAAVLRKVRIQAAGQRLAALVMHAELDGLVCSGPRRGTQFTYALLEERVPRAKALRRDEALAEITRRYFVSHGPATIQDFVWWSGLTIRDAKAGIEMNQSALAQKEMDGMQYWLSAQRPGPIRHSSSLFLLPNYDEYGIAYRDRGAVMDRAQSARIAVAQQFPHMLVIDGQWKGAWRRVTTGGARVGIEVRSFNPLTRDRREALAREGARYGRFLGQAVTLKLVPPPRGVAS